MDARILERDAELSALQSAIGEAAGGAGSVVLVSGEAGIGKSSLVDQLPGLLPAGGRLLVGWCDDLGTPRVLGPLRDLVGSVGPELGAALRSGDRAAVLEALPGELALGPRPTVLAVEDVHWADEASLDVVRFLIRRLAPLPVVLVLTYRDDELPAGHPLRAALGLAARGARVRRLALARLTPAAVRELSSSGHVDADRVFGVTAGNPYFVTEVIRAGDADSVPLTIADAVSSRLVALAPEVLRAVEQLAVIPSGVEQWLVKELVDGGLATLAPAEQQGLLTVGPGRAEFRHELTRRAVVDTMPAARRVHAHQRVLAALLTQEPPELSRVVHHAAHAGDRSAVLAHGPSAAFEAVDAGAHRQAAAHLKLVLDQQPELEPVELGRLYQAYAVECYTCDAPFDEAVAAQRRAVELLRAGDPRELGAALRWLSRISWWAGQGADAFAAGDEAVTVLSGAGDADLSALALSNLAQLHALKGSALEAIAAAEQGLAMRPGPATRSHLLNNLGFAMARDRLDDGLAVLSESLRVALAADDPEDACRAYTNLSFHEIDAGRLDEAEGHVADGIALADRVEHLTFSRYLNLQLARLRFARGDWDAVAPAAADALEGSPPIRCTALTVCGRLHARRGHPEAEALLTEAWELALDVDECQRIGPAACALAEAAVLAGDPARARPHVEFAEGLAAGHGTDAMRAELGYWAGRLGIPTRPRASDHPYALLAEGRWDAAAARWQAAGSVYEAAFAVSHGSRPKDLLAALADLQRLGAEPLERIVRNCLRELGVSAPRGATASSRQNPAGLTPRQLQVARLMSHGLTNTEIAEQLVVSVRTVESHAAAVLDKFGVTNRRELVRRAADLGVADPA